MLTVPGGEVVDALPIVVHEECVFFERSIYPYDVIILFYALIIVLSD